MKTNKITNTKYGVTFTTRPNGATNLLGDDGKMLPGVKSNHTFDFAKLNPDEVEVPDGIMSIALNTSIITFQNGARKSANTGDFDGLKKYLDEHEMIEVGAKSERVAKETPKQFVERMKGLYPKVTPDEIYKLIMGEIDEVTLREKYVEKVK